MNMESLTLNSMDEKTWRKLVLDTANHFGLLAHQIIQDWMGWSLLKHLTKGHENLFVFKGGTSLSQAYQLIDRFSEDIDLAVREVKPGYAFRKEVKSIILSTAKQIGFQVLNLHDIQSDCDFNLKWMYSIKSKFSITPAAMAKAYTALTVGPKLSGFLYDENLKEVKANKHVYDVEAQQRLFDLCEKRVQ